MCIIFLINKVSIDRGKYFEKNLNRCSESAKYERCNKYLVKSNLITERLIYVKDANVTYHRVVDVYRERESQEG